jgi:hypothetical protein
VSRILSVLWEPERLVHGDDARRQLVAACIRIIRTSAQHKDPRDWDTQDYADYGAVVLDMESVDIDDGASETDANSDTDDAETDEDPDPDNDGAPAQPLPGDDESDTDDSTFSDEFPEGGGAHD